MASSCRSTQRARRVQLGGISNVTNEKYYNRVLQNGIEPGAERKVYGGDALGF